MSVFENNQKTASVVIAKDRLKALLVSDRVDCTPDTLELLKQDLYYTISKYFKVNSEQFYVHLSHEEIQIRLTGEDL